jgi:membrane dipeptidase
MIPIIDLHADIPWDITHRRRETKGTTRKGSVLDAGHLSKLRRGGIHGFNAVIWVESEYKPDRALTRGLVILDSILEDLKQTKNFELAKNSKDFRKIFEAGRKIAMFLGVEGGELIEDEITLLRTFYNLGVRAFGLVWNQRNLLADGYGEINTRNGGSGLSEFGVKVVEECNRLGILVDGAHITPNGLSDILEVSAKPIMVSHGSTTMHNGTLRPMSDEHLRQIAANGGIAGIFAINKRNTIPTLESYVDHIEHAVKVAGIDHVGIGFDFVDFITSESLPPSGKIRPIRGLKDVSNSQRVIKVLRQRGFRERDIRKIASENFLRVFDSTT